MWTGNTKTQCSRKLSSVCTYTTAKQGPVHKNLFWYSSLSNQVTKNKNSSPTKSADSDRIWRGKKIPTNWIHTNHEQVSTHTHTHTGTKTTAQAGIYTCKNIQAECRNLAFTLSCPRFKASSPQLGSRVGLSAAYLPPRIICHVEVWHRWCTWNTDNIKLLIWHNSRS